MEEKRLLEGWKEIAGYLKHSVRTCKRWETTLHLPIHRLDGTPRARVFAYPKEIDLWLEEKLRSEEVKSRKSALLHRKKKKLLLVSAAAVVILGVFGIFARSLFPPRLLPIPPDKPTLAIVQFENPTEDDNIEAWRTAFPDLLITDLAQSRYVNVVKITDLFRTLNKLNLGEAEKFSTADLESVAEKARVKYVATGILGKAGQEMTIAVRLHDPKSDEVIKTLEAGCQSEKDIFAAADKLTKKIKLALNLSPRYISHDIDKRVSQVSTNSAQAFKLYSQGYRMAGIDRYQEGISLLQKAVEIDPKFALAYKYLYGSCQNTSREDDEKKYIRKAVDLSHRLSGKERGELETIFYQGYQENPAKANAALERLCRFYPDDRFGSRNLLSSYLDLELWDKALPKAKNAWTLNKTDPVLCMHLSRCYMNLGLFKNAEEVLNEFIDANPEDLATSFPFEARIQCYKLQNKLDAALGEIEKMEAQFPKIPGIFDEKGIIYLYKEDFLGAEREFLKASELDKSDPFNQIESLMLLRDLYLTEGRVEEAKKQLRLGLEIADKLEKSGRKFIRESNLHREMSDLYSITGQLPEALEESEEALRNLENLSGPDPERMFAHQRALINLEMNRMEEFEKQVEEIKKFIEKQQKPRFMRIYYHLLGHRELKKNNFKKAVDYFWKALDLVSVPGSRLNGAEPMYFYSLAEAYNQLEPPYPTYRALSMFEKVILPTVDRLHRGDLYARSIFMIAKFYDRQALDRYSTEEEARLGRSKAIDHYRKFLDLWANADSIFSAEVEEARNRLAVLQSE